MDKRERGGGPICHSSDREDAFFFFFLLLLLLGLRTHARRKEEEGGEKLIEGRLPGMALNAFEWMAEEEKAVGTGWLGRERKAPISLPATQEEPS